MNLELNQNSLLKYLNEKNLNPTFQKETDQIYIEMKMSNFDIPIFFSILSERNLLQTITYLPFQLQEKTLADVARMLHNLNKELDMPGFGIDEKEKLIFYRCVIACLDRVIDKRLLDLCLNTSRFICETFLHAIALIVSGTTSIDEVLKGKPNG